MDSSNLLNYKLLGFISQLKLKEIISPHTNFCANVNEDSNEINMSWTDQGHIIDLFLDWYFTRWSEFTYTTQIMEWSTNW